MPKGHPGTGKTHDLFDPPAHILVVAVNAADRADRFARFQRTELQPPVGVVPQIPTLGTEMTSIVPRIRTVFPAAVELYHQLDGAFLFTDRYIRGVLHHPRTMIRKGTDRVNAGEEIADARFFVAQAFEKNWIDARPRSGKVGGAYCISLPLSAESRILSNFSGNFGDVKTLAHELGHAYHYYVLRRSPHVFRQYPMTLAETASIFAESVVIDGALSEVKGTATLPIVEKSLQDSTQVIVDILSRFKFERAVMERREKGELSAQELCRLMEEAQQECYGQGLNQRELHPYMWAVKPHYYRTELSFYNFPYAFGQLFGLGLFQRYLDEGAAFVPVYRDLLARTGGESAVQLSRRAGFDIESPDFWRRGIALIKDRVDQFMAIV